MKILFVDSNWVLMHLLPNGFQQAGHEVLVSGMITSMQDIVEKIEQFQPQLVMTYGWGNEQSLLIQSWLHDCVKRYHLPHVYWSVEDPIYTDSFVVPVILTSKPDFIFTICKSKVPYYQSLGFPSAHLDWGINPTMHQPVPVKPEYEVDIALVANSYYDSLSIYNDYRIESMLQLIKPLIERGIRIDIWGGGWEHIGPYLGVNVPPSWLRGMLSYLECNQLYSSAKIVIGLQNLRTQVTQRTYEVLAAGGCLLTSDTPAVRELFVPWRDLIITNSPETTIQQVTHYLSNETARKQIGLQGCASVQAHSYVVKAGYIMDTITKAGIFAKQY